MQGVTGPSPVVSTNNTHLPRKCVFFLFSSYDNIIQSLFSGGVMPAVTPGVRPFGQSVPVPLTPTALLFYYTTPRTGLSTRKECYAGQKDAGESPLTDDRRDLGARLHGAENRGRPHPAVCPQRDSFSSRRARPDSCPVRARQDTGKRTCLSLVEEPSFHRSDEA